MEISPQLREHSGAATNAVQKGSVKVVAPQRIQIDWNCRIEFILFVQAGLLTLGPCPERRTRVGRSKDAQHVVRGHVLQLRRGRQLATILHVQGQESFIAFPLDE